MKQTKDMTLCAFFTILIIIASKIVIPVGIIPLTLQTMVVFLSGVLLKPKQIFLSYGLFIMMGLLGLPVFANGGGISYVLQPSFGFLLSFPIAAGFLSILRHKFHLHTTMQLLPICMLALFIIYTIGCIYMYGILNFYMGANKDFASVLAIGALPFVISDSISAVLGSLCALRLANIPVIERTLSCTD